MTLNHEFTKDDNDMIIYNNICRICNKSLEELYMEIDEDIRSSYPMHNITNYKDNLKLKQEDFLNKYAKCLTEEEFVIKQIIE